MFFSITTFDNIFTYDIALRVTFDNLKKDQNLSWLSMNEAEKTCWREDGVREMIKGLLEEIHFEKWF